AAAPAAPPAPPPAPAAALDGLYAHLQAALLRIGFLNPQNPEHLMFALRALIGRAAPSLHEVRILRGMARQVDWAATGGARSDRLPVAAQEFSSDPHPHLPPLTRGKEPHQHALSHIAGMDPIPSPAPRGKKQNQQPLSHMACPDPIPSPASAGEGQDGGPKRLLGKARLPVTGPKQDAAQRSPVTGHRARR
ncbi:MAG: hypothetical protein SF182_29760, partial [Deltaproteobacteria bacterium]|nr:hypothetical protein [Deltaproteobacteria bacterium]